MTATKLTEKLLDEWATDTKGPVALHLKQRLLPVESLKIDENSDEAVGVIYPPTYADIGYNVDTYDGNKKVALIDSPGSQANRLEPVFIAPADSESKDWLVPQLDIVLRKEDCGTCKVCKMEKRKKTDVCESPWAEKVSILELAHRSADAVVQSSPSLLQLTKPAFDALRKNGNAQPLCEIAPTSLVFGVWDSRGGSGEKRPRLIRSIVRAWDVDVLHAAAQFNSIWKSLSEEQKADLQKEAKAKKKKLSEKGLADAPAVFRDPGVRVLGGVLVRGHIERDINLNLVALRGLRGSSEKSTDEVRKYLLGLSLVAATEDIDLFLREGCHLKYAGDESWNVVPRRGNPAAVDLSSDEAVKLIRKYTLKASEPFRKKWPQQRDHAFDIAAAKGLLAKATEEEVTEDS